MIIASRRPMQAIAARATWSNVIIENSISNSPTRTRRFFACNRGEKRAEMVLYAFLTLFDVEFGEQLIKGDGTVSILAEKLCFKGVFGVSDCRQIQPVWWANRATFTAIPRLQGFFYITRFPAACTNSFQCSNKTADLIVQERAGAQGKLELGPVVSFDFFNIQLIKRFHRAFSLTVGGAEGGKIVMADQMVSGLLHGRQIKRVGNLPDQALFMGYGGTPGNQAKQVMALKCRKAGVKIIGDLGNINNCKWLWLQVEIQGLT